MAPGGSKVWVLLVTSCSGPGTTSNCFYSHHQELQLGDLSHTAMAPHSSPLAWKIPRTEEPGRLQSMGSLRVGYD